MCLVRAPDSDRPDSATDPRRPPTSSHSSFLRENTRLGDISPRERGLSELSRRLLRVDFERLTMDMRCICTAASNLSLSWTSVDAMTDYWYKSRSKGVMYYIYNVITDI